MTSLPPVPPEAITAAESVVTGILDQLLTDLHREVVEDGTYDVETLRQALKITAAEAVEAAVPHLAAAEREACAQLADQVDARYADLRSAGGEIQPVTFAPFAALLREDTHG